MISVRPVSLSSTSRRARERALAMATPDDMAVPHDEEALLLRLRAGDRAAFESVFRRYVPELCEFAVRLIDARDDAEEAVQDVFLTLWRTPALLVSVTNLRAYLYRATRNRVLDRLKHARIVRRHEESVILDAAFNTAALVITDATDDTPLSEDVLVAYERTLAELPGRRREIFLLRWTAGLSYADIATELGISEKTVENQLTRALKHLRARLGLGVAPTHLTP